MDGGSQVAFSILKLAINSINLTRYHLSIDGKTFESFALWKDLNLKLPKDSLFSTENIFKGRGNTRLDLTAKSFFINATLQKPALESLHMTIFEIIEKKLGELGERVTGCAAPFVSLTPIKRLAGLDTNIKIWSGMRSDSTNLHIKIVEMHKYLFFGSPNLTKQAFGLLNGEPVNHEAIVLLKKPKGFRLSKVMRGFLSLKMIKLEDDDTIEDFEKADIADSNWVEQKNQAVKGPDEVSLAMNGDGKAEIHVKGSLDKVRKITVHPFSGEGYSEAILEAKPNKRIRFTTKEKQSKLVEAVLSPATPIIKGVRGKDTIWIRELNLGEFWKILENNITSQNINSGFGNGNGRENTAGNSSRKQIFPDVRDLRLTAYQEKISSSMQQWYKWINKYDESFKQNIPDWCINLMLGILNGDYQTILKI